MFSGSLYKAARAFRGARQLSSRPDPLTSASGFLGSLRRQAAQALTASLPESERQELFQKVGGIQPTVDDKKETVEREDIENEMRHSIAEAVAHAKLEEAARKDQEFSAEKSKMAEQAARDRVELENKIQKFQKWHEEAEKRRNQGVEQAAASEEEIEEESNVQHHPILGPAIADFGSKKLHIVKASDLEGITVWKKQRTYRHDRAKAMAKDKMKTQHLGILGVIGLHQDLDGNLSIIDGQHRVGMMSILRKNEKVTDIDFDRILVEVYPEVPDSGDGHATDIFQEINKAEPVKLVDVPGVATAKDRKTITEGAAKLQKAFSEMFSPSQHCKIPNVNIDNLRDALFQSDVIVRHDIKSPAALEAWLQEANEKMAAKYQQPEFRNNISERAMEKAEKNGFFLGLDSTWYSN